MTVRTTESTTAARRLVAAVATVLLAVGSLSACDFTLSLGGTSQTDGGGSGGQGGSGGGGGSTGEEYTDGGEESMDEEGMDDEYRDGEMGEEYTDDGMDEYRDGGDDYMDEGGEYTGGDSMSD